MPLVAATCQRSAVADAAEVHTPADGAEPVAITGELAWTARRIDAELVWTEDGIVTDLALHLDCGSDRICTARDSTLSISQIDYVVEGTWRVDRPAAVSPCTLVWIANSLVLK